MNEEEHLIVFVQFAHLSDVTLVQYHHLGLAGEQGPHAVEEVQLRWWWLPWSGSVCYGCDGGCHGVVAFVMVVTVVAMEW